MISDEKIRSQMKHIEKFVKDVPDETLYYSLRQVCREMQRRSKRYENEHKKRLRKDRKCKITVK